MTQHSALIVDDNWYNRDIFRMALESANYHITEAESGQQGLEILKEKTFNLLVLDLQMPDIDGTRVLESLRKEKLHDRMRVLVVTANPHMATDRVHDLADHVMMKPIDVVAFTRFTQRLQGAFQTQPAKPTSATKPASATKPTSLTSATNLTKSAIPTNPTKPTKEQTSES
jgi:CheY-like chemotaxis protein